MPLTSRVEAFQGLRILAAFGIVVFHSNATEVTRYIGGAGVVVFLFLTAYLSSVSTSGSDFSRVAGDRASRVLGPWLFWTAFYFGIVLLRATRGNYSFFESLGPWTLLRGTWYHLWYLPYAFVVSLTIIYLKPKLSRIKPTLIIAICTLLSVGIWALRRSIQLDYNMPSEASMWVAGFALVPNAYGAVIATKLATTTARQFALSTLFLVPIGFNLALFAFDPYSDVISIVLGLILARVAISINVPKMKVVDWLSSLCLGVYLVHPFVMLCLEQVPVTLPIWGQIWIVFVSSVALTAALRSIRLIKRFV